MAIEYKSQDYTTGKQILVFPDHYVCVAQTFAKGDACAIIVEGKTIIPAGTIWPANDESALGIVFSDLDVTNGDQTGALLIHGFVAPAKLPVIPSNGAMEALKGIAFVGLKNFTGLRARTYPEAVRVEVSGEESFNLNATGFSVSIAPSKTANVDYDVNFSGIAPLLSAESRAGLGYPADITNVVVWLVEIPDVTGIFDYTKVKYNGAAVLTEDCVYIDGKWYLSNAKGLKSTEGVISGGNATFTLSYDTADAKTIAWKYVGLTLQT